MTCAKADERIMWTVQQNVLLILNSVPVTFVTDPEVVGYRNIVVA